MKNKARVEDNLQDLRIKNCIEILTTGKSSNPYMTYKDAEDIFKEYCLDASVIQDKEKTLKRLFYAVLKLSKSKNVGSRVEILQLQRNNTYLKRKNNELRSQYAHL